MEASLHAIVLLGVPALTLVACVKWAGWPTVRRLVCTLMGALLVFCGFGMS